MLLFDALRRIRRANELIHAPKRNFEIIQRLITVAAGYGVSTCFFRGQLCSGTYHISPQRHIRVGVPGLPKDGRLRPALCNDYVVCTVAHELGHAVNDAHRSPEARKARLTARFYAEYPGEAASFAESLSLYADVMLAEEEDAWRIASRLLAEQGYDSWPFFYWDARCSIATYERGFAERLFRAQVEAEVEAVAMAVLSSH